MIVVDASVVVRALLAADGHGARATLSGHELVAPDILDVEVASALRGHWLARRLDDERLARAAGDLARLPVDRFPSHRLVSSALRLRANLTAYDATYVALAELLSVTLVTQDRRIASAPGVRCHVDVLP